jgi:predicted dehydrogenase
VPANSKVQVLSIGVVGSIGSTDRRQIASHPAVEITGLCDVDSRHLAKAQLDHPDAFTCKDYREAFAEHGDEFDAVIVSTPDHTHGPILLMALAHGKQVYGQKPLVHQLEELELVDRAMKLRPNLVTQIGNQRMVFPGRRAAVELLRSGVLGKAIAGYAWTDAPNAGRYFNFEHVLSEPLEPPEHLDWDLWLGPCETAPFRDHLVPYAWRSWWDYGSSGLGDWGVHLLDVIFYGFDELQSPFSVKTHVPVPSDIFHAHPCRTTVTYAVDSERFANKFFPIYFNDCGQRPSRAALGLPPGEWADGQMSAVVCEGDVLAVTAGGRLEIWRDGQLTDGMTLPGLPEFPELNHWHAWVDNIVGLKTELRSPFPDAVRITEVGLLGAKAARFPGEELVWNRSELAFTNHEEANKTIVRREYRDGFGLTQVV